MTFHDLTVTDRRDGTSFTHTNYCESPERAIELARLTFAPTLWHVSIPAPSNEAAKMDMAVSDNSQLSLL